METEIIRNEVIISYSRTIQNTNSNKIFNANVCKIKFYKFLVHPGVEEGKRGLHDLAVVGEQEVEAGIHE